MAFKQFLRLLFIIMIGLDIMIAVLAGYLAYKYKGSSGGMFGPAWQNILFGLGIPTGILTVISYLGSKPKA